MTDATVQDYCDLFASTAKDKFCITLSKDTVGYERVMYDDVAANYVMLARWFEMVRDKGLSSLYPRNGTARSALISVDTTKDCSLSGGKHNKSQQTQWAKYEIDKFCLLVAYVMRNYRRSRQGSRSVAMARLKLIIADAIEDTKTSDNEGDPWKDYPSSGSERGIDYEDYEDEAETMKDAASSEDDEDPIKETISEQGCKS